MDGSPKISSKQDVRELRAPPADKSPSVTTTMPTSAAPPVMRTRSLSGSDTAGNDTSMPKSTAPAPAPAATAGLTPPPLYVRRPLKQEVLDRTRPAFDAMSKTEALAQNAHVYLLPKIKEDAELSRDLKRYKKGVRDTSGARRQTDKYQKAVESLKKLTEKKNRAVLNIAEFLSTNSPFASKIYPLTGAIRDTRTGFYAQLLPVRPGATDYFLCFPGTGIMNNLDKQWMTNVANFAGDAVPKSFQQAVQLAQEIQKEVAARGGTLRVAGHSLGGGMANYVGLKCGLESVCFNPAGMGMACLADLGNQLTEEQLRSQTHLVIEDDPVADGKAIKILQQMSGHSLTLAGRIYDIPKDHPEHPRSDMASRHQLDAFFDLYITANLAARNRQLQRHKASGTTTATQMTVRTTNQTATRTATTDTIADTAASTAGGVTGSTPVDSITTGLPSGDAAALSSSDDSSSE